MFVGRPHTFGTAKKFYKVIFQVSLSKKISLGKFDIIYKSIECKIMQRPQLPQHFPLTIYGSPG